MNYRRMRAAARRFINEAPEVTGMDGYLNELCQCGARRAAHDVAENFMQPCVETGCEDFTMAVAA